MIEGLPPAFQADPVRHEQPSRNGPAHVMPAGPSGFFKACPPGD